MVAPMKALAACLLALSSHSLLAAETAPSREHHAPPGWEGSYHQIHYSLVVRIGDQVIVSGIPAVDGANDEEKVRWLFRELERHLETVGASLEDVVEITSYHVASDHESFRRRMEPVLKVHHEFFKDHYPAWTAVGTTALFSKDAPMELSARAIIGSGRSPRSTIPAEGTTPP